MKKKILLCLFLFILLAKDLCAHKFLNGFEGIPIFKDMEYVEDSLILFDKVEGRYISSKISGKHPIKEVEEFYKKVLPNLGWNFHKSNIYRRGNQVLELVFSIENNLVNDQKEINNFFDMVIKSQKEKEIKNLIIYKKAMYNADMVSENELLDILNPILKSESVWKSHALLLMADYFEHSNNFIKSKNFLEEIVNSELANNEIKIESQRRLKRKFSD